VDPTSGQNIAATTKIIGLREIEPRIFQPTTQCVVFINLYGDSHQYHLTWRLRGPHIRSEYSSNNKVHRPEGNRTQNFPTYNTEHGFHCE